MDSTQTALEILNDPYTWKGIVRFLWSAVIGLSIGVALALAGIRVARWYRRRTNV